MVSVVSVVCLDSVVSFGSVVLAVVAVLAADVVLVPVEKAMSSS